MTWTTCGLNSQKFLTPEPPQKMVSFRKCDFSGTWALPQSFYIRRRKIFGGRRKKNGEGKYLVKENIFFQVRRKRRKIFGDGKYIVNG